MDGYSEDGHDRSTYNTPLHNPVNNTWNFDSAEPDPTPSRSERPRPRPSRTSSLPRALYSAGTSSIFGSGPSHSPVMQSPPDSVAARPPTLALSPPSQENVLASQSQMSTLAGPTRRRDSWYDDGLGSLADSRHIPHVEKEPDDPSSPPSLTRAGVNRRESTTLTTLSRLFAVQAGASPTSSRTPSYTQQSRPLTSYTRNQQLGESAALPDHLYNRGLLEGRHSDITVWAFGHEYKLHRLILDRAPFFRTALSEPWLESNSRATTVHPEDIDNSITQASFELALKRLYGCNDHSEEDGDAIGLFATGCWLEMQDLIESSIESMLRQMVPETLSPLIKLVTSNYYGRAGDKILASAKAMLCRDGWHMPLRYWDGIPGDIVREIVGGDGFFIDGEWERWALAKQILDRRLKIRAIDVGLVMPGSRRKVLKAPDMSSLVAVRFDGTYRRNISSRGIPDSFNRWIGLYTHPDTEPILVLLDEGIHYVHLDFEQLQFIKDTKDVLGLPILPQKVIADALWNQMELRQRVLNTREGEMELGISVTSADDVAMAANQDTTMSILTPTSPPPSKGKQKLEDTPTSGAEKHDPAEQDLDSGSWDGNGKPRKFWIPTSDCNIVMGGNADPVIATSNHTTLQRHASRLSATLQPEDVQWMSDFSSVTSQPRMPPEPNGGVTANAGVGEVRYTHMPPFRFSAEFPNPKLLKEKKRVYSRTVFYAGSLWNIYIQKVASSRTKQLGVYLHRARERDTEEVAAGNAALAQGSVDERIGRLEREMILRSRNPTRLSRRSVGAQMPAPAVSDELDGDGAESAGSAGDHDTARPSSDPSASMRPSIIPSLLERSHNRSTQLERLRAMYTSTSANPASDAEDIMVAELEEYDSDNSDDEAEDERLAAAAKRFHVPTLPPYVDARPTIKTYFKIYSPSRGGRMLSVYESAPDKFNFSQSWGWKSSTLMLDDGLGDEVDDVLAKEDVVEGGAVKSKSNDGKLRFVVCIGNV